MNDSDLKDVLWATITRVNGSRMLMTGSSNSPGGDLLRCGASEYSSSEELRVHARAVFESVIARGAGTPAGIIAKRCKESLAPLEQLRAITPPPQMQERAIPVPAPSQPPVAPTGVVVVAAAAAAAGAAVTTTTKKRATGRPPGKKGGPRTSAPAVVVTRGEAGDPETQAPPPPIGAQQLLELAPLPSSNQTPLEASMMSTLHAAAAAAATSVAPNATTGHQQQQKQKHKKKRGGQASGATLSQPGSAAMSPPQIVHGQQMAMSPQIHELQQPQQQQQQQQQQTAASIAAAIKAQEERYKSVAAETVAAIVSGSGKRRTAAVNLGSEIPWEQLQLEDEVQAIEGEVARLLHIREMLKKGDVHEAFRTAKSTSSASAARKRKTRSGLSARPSVFDSFSAGIISHLVKTRVGEFPGAGIDVKEALQAISGPISLPAPVPVLLPPAIPAAAPSTSAPALPAPAPVSFIEPKTEAPLVILSPKPIRVKPLPPAAVLSEPKAQPGKKRKQKTPPSTPQGTEVTSEMQPPPAKRSTQQPPSIADFMQRGSTPPPLQMANSLASSGPPPHLSPSPSRAPPTLAEVLSLSRSPPPPRCVSPAVTAAMTAAANARSRTPPPPSTDALHSHVARMMSSLTNTQLDTVYSFIRSICPGVSLSKKKDGNFGIGNLSAEALEQLREFMGALKSTPIEASMTPQRSVSPSKQFDSQQKK